MLKFISDKKVVAYSPIVTTFLLEGSTIGHILRMWTTRTAEGQSLMSWLYVWVALVLWWNYYRVIIPNEKWAKWSTVFALVTVAFTAFSVIYFRYMVS